VTCHAAIGTVGRPVGAQALAARERTDSSQAAAPQPASPQAGPAAVPGGAGVPVVLALQRSAGNAAVARRLARSPGGGVVARTPASDLIDGHTHLLDLDEDGLGADLLRRAVGGDPAIAQQVLDDLSSTDRDDVAYGFMQAASADQLATLVGTAPGRALLDRLFDELTAGSVAADEQAQADRIIRAKSQRIGPAAFQQAVLGGALVFPHRLPGMTVLDDAPISAERRPGGRIWVKLPVRVLGTDMFRAETSTLPADAFTSGIELPEDQIVGVRLYDLGGVLVHRPALFLIQLANATDMQVLMTVVDVAALGLTLGSGALVAEGATLGARVLLAADRIAFAVGTISTVIREHRGWILQRFGATGQQFLDYVDIVNSVVLVYGGVRALVGMGQLLSNLRQAFSRWRSAAGAAEGELSGSQRAAVQQINQQTDDVLREVDTVQAGQTAGGTGGPQPTPTATPPPTAPAPETPGPSPAADPRREIIGTIEARAEQIRAARGDMNV